MDTWEQLKIDYDNVMNMPCFPDKNLFPNAHENDIIDEEKSVRWNREEVQRRQAAYENELLRLRQLQFEAIREVNTRIYRTIAEEIHISEAAAEILWNFVYEQYHAFGEMFEQIDDYMNLIESVIKANRSEK